MAVTVRRIWEMARTEWRHVSGWLDEVPWANRNSERSATAIDEEE
ncbi:hypothetical protein [Candidatus Poriferisodalis sp.]